MDSVIVDHQSHRCPRIGNKESFAKGLFTLIEISLLKVIFPFNKAL